ncbi:MAG: hypothetical protein ACXADO_07370 [Candidatus Thorarchaeota archaeon]|jgi:hypothetical protein
MPKKRRSPKGKAVFVVVVIAVIVVAVIAWHDGLIATTSIADINSGDVSVGTLVTVKGELTGRLGNVHTVSHGSNFLVFTWEGTSPPLNSIIVVTGEVSSLLSLDSVTAVRQILIFR